MNWLTKAIDLLSERTDDKQIVNDFKLKWRAKGVDNSTSLSGDSISPHKIVVTDDKRNEGLGTEFMDALVKLGDDLDVRIDITPSADFGGNKNRLIKFYKRFGFVENKGKNKLYETRASMYKEPN